MDKASPLVASTPAGAVQGLVVKFNEGTLVRLNSQQLTSLVAPGEALPTTAGVRDTADLQSQLALANAALSPFLSHVGKLFQQSDARLAELKQRGEERSGRELADLSLYFEVPEAAFGSMEEMELARDALNALDVVEGAYIAAVPAPAQLGDVEPADAGTPDFTSQQGYKGPAPLGVDANFAATVSGGRGTGVRFVDIEGGWRTEHEDFPEMFIESGAQNTTDAWLNHGTAVMGVVGGVDNSYGVTGIAADATFGYSSVVGTSTAAAITIAAEAVGPGGVILIELHSPGPSTVTCTCNTGQCNFVAMEYWQANFDAIATATANGVTVVEAAGNGSVNLDHADYGGAFNRGQRDSGAILIGGSASTGRSPMCWTNHGSRVDMHGWGENVVTLGYGGLYSGTLGVNDQYTATFAGTSSGSAVVAGVTTAMQGAALAVLGAALAPAEMRALLVTTGTGQTTELSSLIGPLPDMRAAIETLQDGAPLPEFTYNCSGVACDFVDASQDLDGTIVARSWSFGDSATSTEQHPSHSYAVGGVYQVTLQVTDEVGQARTLKRSIIVDGDMTVCGDGTCGGQETCGSCAVDCGACVCGDGTCEGAETCSNCEADCGACPTGDLVFVGASGAGSAVSNSLSFTHDLVNAVGQDRLVALLVANRGNSVTEAIPDSVTYAGQSMTLVASEWSGNQAWAGVYMAVDAELPAAAGTYSVDIAGQGMAVIAQAIELSGANQASPIDATETVALGGCTQEDPTGTLTPTIDGTLALDFVALFGAAAGEPLSGQTQTLEVTNVHDLSALAGYLGDLAATAVPLNWDASACNASAHVMVAVAPVASAAECTIDTQCDDSIACSVDTCVDGACIYDTSACECLVDSDCDDNTDCTMDTCDGNACSYDTSACECSNNSDCDDSNACTDDVCSGGQCYNTDNGTCVECTLDAATDLGARGNITEVNANGCVAISQFPDWWESGTQVPRLDGTTGDFPVSVTYGDSCGGDSGAGTIAGEWQSLELGTHDGTCPVLIDLEGSGSIGLAWY